MISALSSSVDPEQSAAWGQWRSAGEAWSASTTTWHHDVTIRCG
jgi:hypothetical protein